MCYVQPGATLAVVPGRLHPTTAMAGEQGGGMAAGPKWPGSVPSLENKEGHLSPYQLSSPSHLSTAICHDLFMLPLLTASRHSESNFYHTHCQRQKTLPDCCPTSAPAYKSFLNKTALNKQKCNSNVYRTLWGNYVSKVLEFIR